MIEPRVRSVIGAVVISSSRSLAMSERLGRALRRCSLGQVAALGWRSRETGLGNPDSTSDRPSAPTVFYLVAW
jgi:hypothetical protein